MTIHVTQEHITEGKKGDCGQCPIALSVMGATGSTVCEAGVRSISLIINGESRRFPTPDAASDFIVNFDMGKRVAPFYFDLPIEEARP